MCNYTWSIRVLKAFGKVHTIHMNFLIATPLTASQVGGPAQYSVGLAKALRDAGHTVSVVSFQDVAHYPSGIRHVFLFVTLCFRLRNIDVAIALDTFSVALPVVLAAGLMRKKSIVRAGGDFLWEQYIERTKEKIALSQFYLAQHAFNIKEHCIFWLQKKVVVRMSDMLVFSTKWQLHIWEDPYMLSKLKIAVIENAYHVEHALSEVDRTKVQKVVWIGRDITLKNVDALDRAIEKVRTQHPTLVYEKYSLLTHTDVLAVLNTCRFIVIPSFSEVSPNLALEALALHVPVILTKESGFYDTFRNVMVWIDPFDIEDITQSIMALMDDDTYQTIHANVCAHKNKRTYTDIAEEFLTSIKSL